MPAPTFSDAALLGREAQLPKHATRHSTAAGNPAPMPGSYPTREPDAAGIRDRRPKRSGNVKRDRAHQ